MKVLLDVNVVLDVLLQREEWLADAQAIWDAADAGTLDCCLATSSVTDIYYIARKLVGQEQASEIVRQCLEALTILPVDHAVLATAHARPEPDFEDAVQMAVAVSVAVDAIVTRDASGFAQSPVPVWTPQQLHEALRTA